MKKYIDRDILADYAYRRYGGLTASDVMRFPTADVEPVKHAKWGHDKWGQDICTNCGKSLEDLFEGEFYYDREELHFCPNCGAKMDLKDKD